MRQALRQNRAGSQVASSYSFPPPIGGWNTVDSLPTMKSTDAVILDNAIPRGGKIELRRGYIDQCTGTTSPVETLIAYRGSPNGDKIFAAAGTDLYNVTTAGALPTADYVSAASARWNYTNFSNDAGRYAILVNGEQSPIKYDDTSFSSNAITGTSGSITLDDADLKWVFGHKFRLHFLEKGTLRMWYLPVNAIAGTANLFDLGPVFSKGGYLVGGARLTLDGGVGPDDFAVYLTNEGQVAIFQGNDPGDSADWTLVGVYNLPKPIGDRSIIEIGTDVLIVTEAGVIPLTAALRKPENELGQAATSRKINSAVASAVDTFGSMFGWQPILYPGRGGLLILNVPTEELAVSMQFVRCSETGGWCRFLGLNAFCWGYANGEVYFGSTLGAYRWDVGASDNGEPVVADILPAFSTFGSRTQVKNFTMVRALMRAPSIVQPALQVVADYDLATVPTAVQTVVTPGDIDPVADALITRQDWTGAAAVGDVGSPRMRISLTGSDDVGVVAVTSDHTELLLVGPGGTDNVLTRPNLPLDVQVEVLGYDVIYSRGGLI